MICPPDILCPGLCAPHNGTRATHFKRLTSHFETAWRESATLSVHLYASDSPLRKHLEQPPRFPRRKRCKRNPREIAHEVRVLKPYLPLLLLEGPRTRTAERMPVDEHWLAHVFTAAGASYDGGHSIPLESVQHALNVRRQVVFAHSEEVRAKLCSLLPCCLKHAAHLAGGHKAKGGEALRHSDGREEV